MAVLLAAACSSKSKDTGAGNTNATKDGAGGGVVADAGNKTGNNNKANAMDSWDLVKQQAGDSAEVGEITTTNIPGFELFFVTTAGGNDMTAGYAVAVHAGAQLRGADAFKAVMASGYNDAAGLAVVAVMFLEHGGAVVATPDPDESASGVTAPAVNGNELSYWYYKTGGMAEDLRRSRVDLTTLAVTIGSDTTP
jgi:hypothetical protein